MKFENLTIFLLAAGEGTRLKPITNFWPKCLMQINKRPLLEYWVQKLKKNNCRNIYINVNYLAEIVEKFIEENNYSKNIKILKEEALFGTAGSIRRHKDSFKRGPLMLIHADNWSNANLLNLYEKHLARPKKCCMTLLAFRCEDITQCGILSINQKDILVEIKEKPLRSNTNLANAAIYIIEDEVLDFIKSNKQINDIAMDVLPNFIERIFVVETNEIHRDIGSFEQLKKAQMDRVEFKLPIVKNEWQKNFERNIIPKIQKYL